MSDASWFGEMDIAPVLEAQMRALNMSIEIAHRRIESLRQGSAVSTSTVERIQRLEDAVATLERLRNEIDEELETRHRGRRRRP